MTYDDNSKYHRQRGNGWFSRVTISKLSITALFCFGVYLVVSNSYNLYTRSSWTGFGKSYSVSIPQRNAWVFAKHNHHLKVVLHVLTKAGYNVITSTTEPKQWDLLWAHDFPFRKEFKASLNNLQQHQKVNKLPGTSSITLKVELARTKLKWIPAAFAIPEEEAQFSIAANRNPNKLWVQKSNNHRGIQIVSAKDIDPNAESTFVQQYIENPLLIDKKKFDIGVYVVYTSVNPLQVYFFEDEVLLRFCTDDYYPLDPSNTRKYVVGDDYIPLDKMPSLKKYYNHGQMSFRNAFFSYLTDKGLDPYKMWSDMRQCITEMFKSKSEEMEQAFKNYHFKQNFFELVRIDFVPDENGNIWLMEVNMSPNLSPDAHPINRIMYTKVVRGALELSGALSSVDERFDNLIRDSSARMRDVILPQYKCTTAECLTDCGAEVCKLCHHCLGEEMKISLPKAFREHQKKGSFKRLLPIPLRSDGIPTGVSTEPKGEYNQLLSIWFKRKCRKDHSWCQ